MNLECGHEEEAGLVCPACAVEVLRAGTRLEESLLEASGRLALIRRYAGVWKAVGGPLMQYLAGRLVKVLEADAGQLEAFKVAVPVAARPGSGPKDLRHPSQRVRTRAGGGKSVRHRLARETVGVLRDVLRDIEEFLEEPGAELPVGSEEDLRRAARITGRPRAVLCREMERAESVRSSITGRAFDPPPTLGTLLRLARLEVKAALAEVRRGDKPCRP